MPNAVVKSYAKQTGKSPEHIEGWWKEAEHEASKKFKKKSPRYWAYVNGIVKRRGKIKESLTFKEFLLLEKDDDEIDKMMKSHPEHDFASGDLVKVSDAEFDEFRGEEIEYWIDKVWKHLGEKEHGHLISSEGDFDTYSALEDKIENEKTFHRSQGKVTTGNVEEPDYEFVLGTAEIDGIKVGTFGIEEYRGLPHDILVPKKDYAAIMRLADDNNDDED